MVSEKEIQMYSREMSYTNSENWLSKNQKSKACVVVNSRRRQIQLAGESEVDFHCSISTTQSTQNDNVIEIPNSPGEETLHVSISSGKSRSTTVVSKDEQNDTEIQSVVEYFEREEIDDDEKPKVTNSLEKLSVFSRLDIVPHSKGTAKADHEDLMKENIKTSKNKNVTLKNQQHEQKVALKTDRLDIRKQRKLMNEKSLNVHRRSRSNERTTNDARSMSQRVNARNQSPRRQHSKFDSKSDNRHSVHQQRLTERGRPNFHSKSSDVRRDYRAENCSHERMHDAKHYGGHHQQSLKDDKSRMESSTDNPDERLNRNNPKVKNDDTQITDEKRMILEEVRKLDTMIAIKTKKYEKKTSESDQQQAICESASINLAIHSNESTPQELHGNITKLPISTDVSKQPKSDNIQVLQQKQQDRKQHQPQRQQHHKEQQLHQQHRYMQHQDQQQLLSKIDTTEDRNKQKEVQPESKRKLSQENTKSQSIPPSKKAVDQSTCSRTHQPPSINQSANRLNNNKDVPAKSPTKDTNLLNVFQQDDNKVENKYSRKRPSETHEGASQDTKADVSSDSEKTSAESQQSESSKDSEPQRKKKAKHKRKKSHVEEDKPTDTSASDDDSDSDSEPSKKRKRKRKKKKRKKSKKNRHSKKRKRKSDKGTFVSAEELASMKLKMKEEILKEIKTGITEPMNTKVTPTSDVSTLEASVGEIKSKVQESATDDDDDLELDYSSEDDEIVDQHGFLTGIQLRRTSDEIQDKKTPEIIDRNEEVVEVFNDILDLDLDEEDDNEENWKRHKKDDDTNKQPEHERRNDTRRPRYRDVQPKSYNLLDRNRDEKSSNRRDRFGRNDRYTSSRNSRSRTSPRDNRCKINFKDSLRDNQKRHSPKNDREKEVSKDHRVKESAKEERVNQSSRDDQVKDSPIDSRRSASTRNDRVSDSTKDDQVSNSTKDDRVSDSTKDDRVSDSTKDDRVNASTRDNRANSFSEDDRVNSSVTDNRVNALGRGDRISTSAKSDRISNLVNTSPKNNQVNIPTRDERVNASVRDNRVDTVARDHRVNPSTRSDRVNTFTRDNRVDISARDSRVHTSARDYRANTSARDDRVDTSKRDDRVNTFVRDDRVNDSTKDDRVNIFTRGDRVNTSTRDNRVFTSAKGDRVNDSTRDNRVHTSARDDRVNTSTRGNRVNVSMRDNQVDTFTKNDRVDTSTKDDRVKSDDRRKSTTVTSASESRNNKDVKSSNTDNESMAGFKRHRFDEKSYKPSTSSTSQMKIDIKSSKRTPKDTETKFKDGIAIAKEVRSSVYKLDNFWKLDAGKEIENVSENTFDSREKHEHDVIDKTSNSLQSTIGESGHWESPYIKDDSRSSHIRSRLLNIAESSYDVENNDAISQHNSEVNKDLNITIDKHRSRSSETSLASSGDRKMDSKGFSVVVNRVSRRHCAVEEPERKLDRSQSYYDTKNVNKDELQRADSIRDRRHSNYSNKSNLPKDDLKQRELSYKHDRRPPLRDNGNKRHHPQDRPSPSVSSYSRPRRNSNDISSGQYETANQHSKLLKHNSKSFALSLNRLDGSGDSPNIDNTMTNDDYPENFTHPKKHYRVSKNR